MEKFEDNSYMVIYVVQVIKMKKKKSYLSICNAICKIYISSIFFNYFFCFSVRSCRMGAKVLVNWLNTKLVLIPEDMRKLADACPTNDDT